jgi:cytochrome c-type biogenesis protein CcmH
MRWLLVTKSACPERSRGTLRNVSRIRSTRTGWVLAFALLFAAPAFADSSLPPSHWANRQLPDPRQEARAQALMQELRCLVCQGQSIADSDADLAGDMRALVRERIAAGDDPRAIRAWLVERYGNWVSFKPPLEPLTWPLWVAPILLLAAGAWIVRGRLKR